MLCGLLKGFSCWGFNVGFSDFFFFFAVQIEKECWVGFCFLLSLFMDIRLKLLKIYSFYSALIQVSEAMAHFEFRPKMPAMA